MKAIEATITNVIDINTVGGGHLRLMPGQYRVTPDRMGGAELVRIDVQQPASPILLTPVQWGILEAARFIERSPQVSQQGE
jgi:hypothetical protein